ncbi:MAG TPA: ATP-binding cassette domain-containing protein, partial [Acidimicrobiales bacterium]|nr:ATP-binding cassette domain-containing protein [Acidimicrobiales bacterium]
DGGWDAYVHEKEIAARLQQEAYENYAGARSELLGRASREKQWATSGVVKEKARPKDNDKVQRDFRVNRTEQLAARARRTEKAIQRLEAVEKPWEEWQLQYSLKSAPRAGAIVAELADAVVTRGEFRLGPVTMTVAWGTRLAVTGRNGGGKTTLVQTLLGRIGLDSGRQYLGPGVMVGELGQERSGALAGALGAGEVASAHLLAPGRELLRSFIDATGLEVPEARTLLAKFGLGPDHVLRPGWTLSPGERTRAQLACFQAVGVNFLVLDEPTNHLDMPAIEQLEQALDGYDGTLLVVTHDRKMLESLRVTERAEVARGTVTVVPA